MKKLRKVNRDDYSDLDEGGVLWYRTKRDYYVYKLGYKDGFLVGEWFRKDYEMDDPQPCFFKLLKNYRFLLFDNFTHGCYTMYWICPWGLVPVDKDRYTLVDEKIGEITQPSDGERTDPKYLMKMMYKHMSGGLYVYM